MYYIIEEAISSIKRHNTRSFLSGLGVFLGMSILVVTDGTTLLFEKHVTSVLLQHAECIAVHGGVKHIEKKEGESNYENVTFTLAVIEDLKRQTNLIKNISLFEKKYARVKTINGKVADSELIATDSHYQSFSISPALLKGRFISEYDINRNENVAIISSTLASQLYGTINVIGQLFQLENYVYKITGVFDSKEVQTIIPYSTYLKKIKGKSSISGFYIKPNTHFVGNIKQYIQQFLALKLGLKKPTLEIIIQNNIQNVQRIQTLILNIKTIMGSLSGTILFLGLFGVANVMYLAINERKREIGIRKALGENIINIRFWIVLETTLLMAIPGLLGCLVGYVLFYFFGIDLLHMLVEETDIIEGHIRVDRMIYQLLLLITLGAITGLIPAWRASKVIPVKALYN